VAVRRTGYAFAAVINAAILYLLNVWPGWEELSFLTEETTEVLGLVNFSLALGVLLNVVYLFADPAWFKVTGELLTALVSLLVVLRVIQVFPFDFSTWNVDWTWLVWTILIIAAIGTFVGAVVQLVTLVRVLTSGHPQSF
jgi:protein-S-isoprenylcysteine O-methyltransferase Ste14